MSVNINIKTFTDARDGVTYKTVEIGGKTWFAENLRYKADDGCGCFDGNESNLGKFGRVYTWEAAKAVCPAGWHLPSGEEWAHLGKSVGGEESDEGDTLWYLNAGTKLKSKDTWKNGGDSDAGEDSYGFCGLPDGFGKGGRISDSGQWWSATEHDKSRAYVWTLDDTRDDAYMAKDVDKKKMFAVRCVKD